MIKLKCKTEAIKLTLTTCSQTEPSTDKCHRFYRLDAFLSPDPQT